MFVFLQGDGGCKEFIEKLQKSMPKKEEKATPPQLGQEETSSRLPTPSKRDSD